MQRKGLGLKRGMGYKNIIPKYDSHRHALNAKGYKMPQRMPMMHCGGKKYNFFSDPAHGWVKVKLDELKRLGIDKDISDYSYIKGEYAYLEEDSDATKFIEAKKRLGEKVEWNELISDKSSKIRNYDNYRTYKENSDKYIEDVKRERQELEEDRRRRVMEMGGKCGGKYYRWVDEYGEKRAGRIIKEKGDIIEVKDEDTGDELILNKRYTEGTKGGKCSPSDLKYGTAPDSQFDASQLKQGVKVETEHTPSRKVAKAIAKAHLKEMPDYYTKLRKMERGGKKSLEWKTLGEKIVHYSDADFKMRRQSAWSDAKQGLLRGGLIYRDQLFINGKWVTQR